MQAYRIQIQPVSPGTREAETMNNLRVGAGQYARTPAGPVVATLDLTQVQIVGVQGYIACIKAGLDTSSIETAITAVGPT